MESLHGYRPLRSGELSLHYGQGEIRRICLGRVQVVNAIYAAVRDQNWTTIPFQITQESIREHAEGFDIETELEYAHAKVHYRARMEIKARDKSLKVSYQGRAESSFHRNRIGFCLLHPLKECRGRNVTIFHPDGSTTRGKFPETISPHQPFINISGMSWEPAAGISARLEFEGDLFETEDQRNWSDASYKTYCTPLEKPFPVKVNKDDEVSQSLTLSVETSQELSSAATPDQGIFHIRPGQSYPLPEIGTARSTDAGAISREEADLLRSLPLRHLRADLDLGNKRWEKDHLRIREEQKLLEWPVELALHFGVNPLQEVHAFLQKQAEQPLELCRLLVFDAGFISPDPMLVQVIDPLQKALPGIPIGGGSDANFAKLNRNPPDATRLDFVTFSICPQVHAFDELTLVENLEAQPQLVEDARNRFQKPVSIGALTLRQRFNAVATDEKHPGTVQAETDPRQHTSFAAGWTLASLRQLSLAGTTSVTYYETVGSRGILSRSGTPRGASPLFHLFQELASPGPLHALRTESSRPLEFDGICLKGSSGLKILLANLGRSVLEVNLDGPGAVPEALFILREFGWEAVTASENNSQDLTLEPAGIYKILVPHEK